MSDEIPAVSDVPTVPAIPAVVPPAPAPAAPVASEPKANVVTAFLGALLDHSPDSLRRLGAVITAAVLPFLNAACQAKLGFSAPENQILAAEGALSLYITQSFLKALKTGPQS